MAEAVLFGLATSILESLAAEFVRPGGSFASQKIQLVCCVEGELQSLMGTVEAIRALLLDAEKKHWHNHQVTLWLRRLKEVLYDVQDLIDDVKTEEMRRKLTSGNKLWEEVCVFFSESNPVLHSFKVANEIQKLRKTLDEIAENSQKFNLEERRMEEPMAIGRVKPEVYKPDDQIIGRKEAKEEIKQLLFNSSSSQSVSGVAIVGIGGLGKTALAQLVYSDADVKKHFGLKMRVCVTHEFNVELVIKGIIESAKEDCAPEDRVELEESLRDIANTQNRALRTSKLQELLRKMLGGKKYLLVLDDVWVDVRGKWSELGDWLKYGPQGSKILVTTRNREVAKTIDKDSAIYDLKGLSRDASWDLFREEAFGNRHTPVGQRLEEMGRVIVGKCAGVPLAIRTVGSFLCGKNEDEWLRCKVLDLPDMRKDESDNGIMQCLQFSYDHLSSWLKQCFAYCSLFPKDYVYRKDVILRLWMAQGFMASRDVQGQGFIASRDVEERAEKYLSTLLDRSFLDVETVGDGGEVLTFKMHDLMHDLASKVAGDECKFVKFKGEIGEGIRLASIISHIFSQDELVSFLEKSKLRTLFLHLVGDGLREESSDGRREESIVLVCHKVFSRFRHCRVLGFLGETDIPLSPSGNLKHLRFLDVSENPSIENLPDSITDLLNLETLIVSNCKNLSALPRDLGKLVNLSFLDVSRNESIRILLDSIADLPNLQTLKLSHLALPNVDSCIPPSLGSRLKHLRFLDVSGNKSIEILPDSIADLLNLQTLKLSNCSALKALPRHLKKLVNLRHLLIDGCSSLTHMPCGLDRLSSLQTLSKFVVQKMDHGVPGGVGRLDELGELNKLAGSINLENLGLLQPVLNKAPLREKKHLRSLDLSWWTSFDDRSESDESIVWENLRPHQNLTHLDIIYYTGRNPPSWLSSISYLVTLTLSHCSRWKYLPPLSELPSLRELNLVVLNELEFVQEIRDPQQSNTARPFFPSLERMYVSNCFKLRGWWGRMLPVGEEQDLVRYHSQSSFPKLSYLEIQNCKDLKSLPLLPSVLELSFYESSVKILEQQVVAVPDYSSEAALVSTFIPLSKLKKLDFDSIRVWDDWMLETLLPFLRNLESMSFSYCSELWSLSSGMRYLSSLQHLKIERCYELDLWSHDDSEHGTQWRSLVNLRTLEIIGLPQLKELPEGIQHVTTLQSLSIRSCENLTSLPEWIGNFSLLQELDITRCPGIECLPNGMSHLTSLKSLRIGACPTLESRCQPGHGDDWGKIKHIAHLSFQPRYITDD